VTLSPVGWVFNSAIVLSFLNTGLWRICFQEELGHGFIDYTLNLAFGVWMATLRVKGRFRTPRGQGGQDS
ncbi:MAG TPA: hypothetical protein VE136_15685, partial [Anaerolineales bacterium]|nr:hypothetical protein [Anaerolineales bacterium]